MYGNLWSLILLLNTEKQDTPQNIQPLFLLIHIGQLENHMNQKYLIHMITIKSLARTGSVRLLL
jgi:hypothetical protein